jgi:hypothetical protein
MFGMSGLQSQTVKVAVVLRRFYIALWRQNSPSVWCPGRQIVGVNRDRNVWPWKPNRYPFGFASGQTIRVKLIRTPFITNL